MYRKGLIGLLQDHPASVRELSRTLAMAPADVEDDLRHLLKSLHHMPYRAVVAPAVCKKCGFVFSRDKLHKPGRCPQCHGSRISAPLIGIEATR